MTHQALITKFYQSFAAGDVEGMIACYHDDITFQDPAFGELHGEAAKSMWKMLLSGKKDAINIQFSDVVADNHNGSASWVAKYTYGKQKRKVTNHISATFKFLDGKIIDHRDHFDLWKWSKQALGTSGYLLGWSPFMRNKIQQTTNKQLRAFMKK